MGAHTSIYYWQRRPGIGSYKKRTVRYVRRGVLGGPGEEWKGSRRGEGQACGRCLAGGAGAERPRAMCPGPVRPTAPPELSYARSRAYSAAAAAASVASSPAQAILEAKKKIKKNASNNHNNSIHGLEICCDPSVRPFACARFFLPET